MALVLPNAWELLVPDWAFMFGSGHETLGMSRIRRATPDETEIAASAYHPNSDGTASSGRTARIQRFGIKNRQPHDNVFHENCNCFL